jgi:isopropylmalate/homocitrate/citramalate synthase
MSIENLKKALETALLITDWSPTERDLQEIFRRIKNLRGLTSKTDIEKIVYDVVGSYECMVMDGVDNTDLTTLLLMATKTTDK